MKTVRQMLIWSLRAWPVIIILVMLCIHTLMIYYFRLNASSTNKVISLILQVVGGLLILYSIDSNIGVIRRKSLYAIFVNYLKEFPLIKKSIVIEVTGTSMGISAGKAKLSVVRNPKTIEEQLAYLQEQIYAMKKDYDQEIRELNEKIDYQSHEIRNRILETDLSLKNIESKIDEVSIGGINDQLFGIMLMVYGSISGYLA